MLNFCRYTEILEKSLMCWPELTPHALFHPLFSIHELSSFTKSFPCCNPLGRENTIFLNHSILGIMMNNTYLLTTDLLTYWLPVILARILFSICIVDIETYHSNTVIVDLDKIFLQRNFLNFKCDAFKTELSGNVHSPELHIHGNQLHSTNSSVKQMYKYFSKSSSDNLYSWLLFRIRCIYHKSATDLELFKWGSNCLLQIITVEFHIFWHQISRYFSRRTISFRNRIYLINLKFLTVFFLLKLLWELIVVLFLKSIIKIIVLI